MGLWLDRGRECDNLHQAIEIQIIHYLCGTDSPVSVALNTPLDRPIDRALRGFFIRFCYPSVTRPPKWRLLVTNKPIYHSELQPILERSNRFCTWKIEAVDQKIKDFVESQLKIGEAANSAITSGMQLHPSLTNIMVNGKLASGSEMLYAHQIYKLSDVAIPEMVILDPINQAIRFNFPETDLQLGFYHQSLMTQEETAPEDRIRNN